MRRYAVIPTTGRPELQECLDAIQDQVDFIYLIAHDCVPEYRERPIPVEVITYNENPPNISRMWNIGLDAVDTSSAAGPYHIAVLNDDAFVPPHWFASISSELIDRRAAAGSTDQFGVLVSPALYTQAEPINMHHRMSGFAYVLDGEKGLRLDEQFHWWYGDDDLEWRARLAGGVVRVPGTPVHHKLPGGTTVGELALIAGEDRQRFIDKWGKAPH